MTARKTRSKGGASALRRKARMVLRIEAEAVDALRDSIDANFEKAVRLLAAAKGRVVVIGVGKSGLVGRKLTATLSSTGTPALFLHPVEALHGDLGMIHKGDVVLALSYSGETEEMKKLLPLIKDRKCKIVSITGRPRSHLARQSDVTVTARVRREACPHNITPTASSTATLAMGDALAICLMDKKGFSRDDFAKLHPAGSLGKKLTLTVGEIMRKGAENPIVGQGASIQDALLVMTRSRAGATSIVDGRGRLVGFFTDGDLRRRLQRGESILRMKVRAVMTRRPIHARPDQLVSEIAPVFREREIDNLPVLDPKTRKPVGLLDERDLLAEGVF